MFSIILWKVISSDNDRHFPEIEFHILQQHILKIRWLTKWTIWNGLSASKCSLIFKILTLLNNRSDDIDKLFCKDLPTIWEGFLLCSRKVCFGNIFYFIFCFMIILVLEISLCNFRNIVVACWWTWRIWFFFDRYQ